MTSIINFNHVINYINNKLLQIYLSNKINMAKFWNKSYTNNICYHYTKHIYEYIFYTRLLVVIK